MNTKARKAFEEEEENIGEIGEPSQRHKDLFIYCNLLELLRLRENLMMTMHETSVLNKIHKVQSRFLKVTDNRYLINVPKNIKFEEDDFRYDFNKGDGLKCELPLAIFEYDTIFRSHLDFFSRECIKHLVTIIFYECQRS